jgi:GLPGLI family protein
MKKYILVGFLILCSTINAQIKSGVVNYGVTISENKESKVEKMMLSMNTNYYSIAKEFQFKLKFIKEKAFFAAEEKMYSDENAARLCEIKIGFLGNSLVKNDSLYTEGSSRGIGNFLEKKVLSKNWVLLNETKLIDNYLCYKATTENIVANSVKTFRHPITAWYCPQIPFPYGPLGYGGLPGLILELQTKDGVYGAKKIQLNSTDIPIDELKKYKVIDAAELDKLIEKKYSN